MRFYRCRCGKAQAWSSMGSPACRTCPKCGSDLAEGPDGHSTEPAPPHDWVTKYNQDTGAPYDRCQRCSRLRSDIEADAEPEPEEKAPDAADDYMAATKPLTAHAQCPYPHCDAAALHAPGTCQYCDLPEFKPLHDYRARQGINYTGESDPSKKPCPAEVRRSAQTIHRWPGNRPKAYK